MAKVANNARKHGEEGFALLVTVLLMLLVGGMGVALLVEATTETRTNANVRGSLQAHYAAHSGLEEARARVPVTSLNALALPTAISSVVYIVDSADVDPTNPANPWYDGGFAAEFPGVTPTVTSVASLQGNTNRIPYKWVRLTMKTEASSAHDINRDSSLDSATAVYWDGSSQNLAASGKPVYKLTALAVAPGGARSLLQLEGSQPPPFSSDAALASEDDVRLQGNFSVSGIDYCGQTSPVYGVKTTADIDTSGNAGTTTGLTGPSPNETGTYEDAPDSYDIDILINSLKEYATPIRLVDTSVTYSASTNTFSGSNVRLGTPPPQPPPANEYGVPVITYAAGHLSLSSNNSQGAGILIVDGDLNVNGGFYYYGLIVVRGIVSFTGGGSNSVNIYGSIVSGASIVNSTNVGGGVNVQYDSCAIKNPYESFPLKVLSFREIFGR